MSNLADSYINHEAKKLGHVTSFDHSHVQSFIEEEASLQESYIQSKNRLIHRFFLN